MAGLVAGLVAVARHPPVGGKKALPIPIPQGASAGGREGPLSRVHRMDWIAFGPRFRS